MSQNGGTKCRRGQHKSPVNKEKLTSCQNLRLYSVFCELFLFISSIVLLMFGVFFVSLRDYKYVNFVREFQYMIVFVLIIHTSAKLVGNTTANEKHCNCD